MAKINEMKDNKQTIGDSAERYFPQIMNTLFNEKTHWKQHGNISGVSNETVRTFK